MSVQSCAHGLAAGVALLVVAASPLGAGAQDAAPAVMSNLSATQVFEVAARAETLNDLPTATTLYTALARDPDVEVRAEARFRHARLLSAGKRFAEAAVLLRAILDEKPDAQRVRLELASVMAAMGDERAAYRTLRQVQAGGLPPEVALAVDQFANALRSRKPYGASLELSLAPDSNINRATSADTLDTVIAPLQLSPDAQQQSGVGVRIGGQVYVRPQISEALHFTGRLSGQTNTYAEGAFNDMTASAQVGLEWSRGASRFSPAIGQSYRWYGDALYAVTDTASLDWRRSLGSKAQLSADIAVGRSDYQLNDLQSGNLYDLSVGYERAFSATSGGGVTVSAQRQTANDPGYATKSGGVGLVYWREAGKMTVFGSANMRLLTGDTRLALFAAARDETYLRVGVGATFRQIRIRGFSPVVRASHERNKSTVGLYDYNRNALEFGVARSF